MKKSITIPALVFLLASNLFAQRVAIIGDERENSPNLHLAPEMLAAAAVEKFDCEVVVRFESSAVLRENIIGAGEVADSLSPTAPAVENLAYVSSLPAYRNFVIKFAELQEGMEERTEMVRFFKDFETTKVKKVLNGNLTPASREGAAALAKRFGYTKKSKRSAQELEAEKNRPFSVAVMAPKVGRLRSSFEKVPGTWAAEARAVQDLVETTLPESFPQVTLLDRSRIGDILQEKQLAFLGKDPTDSVEAMRLLGADYLIRPVVSLVGKDGKRLYATRSRNLGFEVTFLVIRSSDGMICSSVMHRGKYTVESALQMVPLLEFPVSKKEQSRLASRDETLRAWEADFYLGLGAQTEFRSGRNAVYEDLAAYKCVQAAHSLVGSEPERLSKMLLYAGRSLRSQGASWQRDKALSLSRKRYEEACENTEVKALSERLTKEATRFFESMSLQLDVRNSPRMLLHQASFESAKGNGARALDLLEEYRRGAERGRDLRTEDYFYYLNGIKALTLLDRPADCAVWIRSRPRFDTPQLLLLTDCLAAQGKTEEEFQILKLNRRLLEAGEMHQARMLELAREFNDTEFLFPYLLKELSSWDYNLPEFQWELYLSTLAAGEEELAKGLVAMMRDRHDYGPRFAHYEEWEKAAGEHDVIDNPDYARRFPFEINPIGDEYFVEFLIIGSASSTALYEESAQELATLLGCPVKMYQPIPSVIQPGVYDFQGGFYYSNRLLDAALLARAPDSRAISRVVYSRKKMSYYDMKRKRAGARVYSYNRKHGKIYTLSSVYKNPDPKKYGRMMTTLGVGLSNLVGHASNKVETGNILSTFTRNTPDPTGANGTYDVAKTFRASYGKVNGEIYGKIDWDLYHQDYQDFCSEFRDEADPALEEAAKFMKVELEKAEAGAKIFRPGEVTPEIELMRTFDHVRPQPRKK